MFHSIVVLDDTGGGKLHVGFVCCFGEPAVQWAFVNAEGQPSGLGSIRVSKVEEFKVEIPPDIAQQGGTLTIEFRMPKAASPKSMRTGGDTRMLGIQCYTLQLRLGASG